MKESKDFKEFWPFYLSQHSKKTTRNWHFIGTSFVFLCIVLTIVFSNGWLLLLAPIIAY